MDATRAHYLGFRHGTNELVPWRSLTTGRPAALDPGANRRLRADAAQLVGLPAADLATSSLHGLIDVVLSQSTKGSSVFFDAALYPIATLAIAASGLPRQRYRHFATASLREAMRRNPHGRPIVVTDGFCPGCGRVAPLADLVALVVPRNGVVIVDDTASFGLLGPEGGGLVRDLPAIDPSRVVVVASAAKAFGAPIAIVTGSDENVRRQRERGILQSHGSPPGAAAVAALGLAFTLNGQFGDARRQRLLRNVAAFRHVVTEETGRSPDGGDGPLQAVPTDAPTAVVEALRRRKFAVVATARRCLSGSAVTAVLRADHRRSEVEALAWALTRELDQADAVAHLRMSS